MEFLVFCAFFEEEQTAPLNKVQVWGYSDAVASATAPYCPAMFAKLPNRPCDWKAFSSLLPQEAEKKVVVATRRQLLSQSAELELRDPGIRYAANHLLTRSDFAPCSYNLRKQGLKNTYRKVHDLRRFSLTVRRNKGSGGSPDNSLLPRVYPLFVGRKRLGIEGKLFPPFLHCVAGC